MHAPRLVVEAVDVGGGVGVVVLAGGQRGGAGASGLLGGCLARGPQALLALARVAHVLVKVLCVRKVALLRLRVQRHCLLKEPCAQQPQLSDAGG